MADHDAETTEQSAPQAESKPKKSGILGKVLIVLVLLIAGFLVVVAMQPAEFQVVRSATMSAPAPAVFEEVNDLHKWQAWSPWAEKDPNAENTFEGPDSGEGAVFKWSGNQDVGEGSMTITESNPYELIKISLHFIKPFEDKAEAQFTFEPAGDQTTVTWTMDGKNNFIGKIFYLLMDMDQMIGGDFEQGLANLKGVVEEQPADEVNQTAASEST